MRTSLRRDLTAALKSRDRVTVSALRSALAAIDNAESIPVEEKTPVMSSEHLAGTSSGLGSGEAPRRELTDADLRAIVEREVQERSAAAAEYDGVGRPDAARRLRSEAEVLSRYLR